VSAGWMLRPALFLGGAKLELLLGEFRNLRPNLINRALALNHGHSVTLPGGNFPVFVEHPSIEGLVFAFESVFVRAWRAFGIAAGVAPARPL